MPQVCFNFCYMLHDYHARLLILEYTTEHGIERSFEWINDVESRNCLKNACRWVRWLVDGECNENSKSTFQTLFIPLPTYIVSFFLLLLQTLQTVVFIRTNMTMRCLLLNSGRCRCFVLTLFGGDWTYLYNQREFMNVAAALRHCLLLRIGRLLLIWWCYGSVS